VDKPILIFFLKILATKIEIESHKDLQSIREKIGLKPTRKK
jgi:hypothetical protein